MANKNKGADKGNWLKAEKKLQDKIKKKVDTKMHKKYGKGEEDG